MIEMGKHVIEDFKHELSSHCESSTLRDLIMHENIPISEEMVFGLDSTFGFTFWDNLSSDTPVDDPSSGYPMFVGGKQGTITKDSMACRILGLNITMETFTSVEVAWESSKKLLDQDIPVGIQLDLGFLSYMEEEEGVHFGGHWVALVGYDDDKGMAYVSETNQAVIQEVPIEMLLKARNSKHGYSFVHPHNKQITIKRRPDGKKPPFARAVKLALQEVSRHFLSPSMNYHGIPAMNLFIKSIPKWPETLQGQVKHEGKMTSKAYFALDIVYGLIETWGTGGAAFRNLHAGFLKELLNHPEINEGQFAWNEEEKFYLEDAGGLLFKSAGLWNDFTGLIRKGLDEGKENILNYIDLKELEEIFDQIIPLEKECFKNLLNIKL